jgi:hypothetical protein
MYVGFFHGNVTFVLSLLALGVIMFNATFNNILAISRRSALLEEETGVHGEHHRPVASH